MNIQAYLHDDKSIGYGRIKNFNETMISFQNSNTVGSSGSFIYSLTTTNDGEKLEITPIGLSFASYYHY